MRTNTKKTVLTILLLLTVLFFLGCRKNPCAKGHQKEITEGFPATCTKTGLTNSTHCLVCGEILEQPEVINAVGHKVSQWTVVKVATKITDGLKIGKCDFCGEEMEEIINNNGSEGLYIERNKDGKTCIIAGIGECTDKELYIPAKIDGLTVTAIKGYAFIRNQNLTSVTIPSTVKEIGQQAFSRCDHLKEVNLNEGLEIIGEAAFMYNGRIKSVVIPNSVKEIGTGAFYLCTALDEVVIPDSVETIKITAFHNASFTNYKKHPEKLDEYGALYIGKHFYRIEEAKQPEIVIKEGTTEICGGAFYESENIASVKIPSTVTYIGESAFASCKDLKSVEMTDSVTAMAQCAFFNCIELESIKLSANITEISKCEFYGCSKLTEITIPTNVTKICDNAFRHCTSLKIINYKGTVDEWNAIEKGREWDWGISDYIIICKDGETK